MGLMFQVHNDLLNLWISTNQNPAMMSLNSDYGQVASDLGSCFS